jgi:hypothetical protein
MNYEIKSAKEADVHEIFFDKTAKKLSFKTSLGIAVPLATIDDLNNVGDGYIKTVIDILPPAIIAGNVTEVILLPAQSGLNYDEVDKIVVEYTHNGTPYSISISGFIKIFRTLDSGSNGPIKWIHGSMLSTAENSLVVPETSTITNTIEGFPQQTNNRQTLAIMQSALVLKLTHAATLGNGTLKITVYSKTRTFGA